jgi:hypothetical protein
MAVIFRAKTDDMTGGKLETSGIYQVEVRKLTPEVSKSGNNMMAWMASVTEGSEKSKVCYGRILIPTPDIQWPRQRWMRMLESFGFSGEEARQIMNEGLDDEKHVIGQQGWIEFTPPIGEGSFAEAEWITEAQAVSRIQIAAEARVARAELTPADDLPF